MAADSIRRFAESLLQLPPPAAGKRREIAIVAARVLLRTAGDAGWSVIWPAFKQDVEFGQEVILPIASGPGRHDTAIAQRLSEHQLADLYMWVAQQYPHSDQQTWLQ